MKTILEFEMPAELEELRAAQDGLKWKFAFQVLADFLRLHCKHVDHTKEEYDIFNMVRDRMTEILEEEGLRLYE